LRKSFIIFLLLILGSTSVSASIVYNDGFKSGNLDSYSGNVSGFEINSSFSLYGQNSLRSIESSNEQIIINNNITAGQGDTIVGNIFMDENGFVGVFFNMQDYNNGYLLNIANNPKGSGNADSFGLFVKSSGSYSNIGSVDAPSDSSYPDDSWIKYEIKQENSQINITLEYMNGSEIVSSSTSDSTYSSGNLGFRQDSGSFYFDSKKNIFDPTINLIEPLNNTATNNPLKVNFSVEYSSLPGSAKLRINRSQEVRTVGHGITDNPILSFNESNDTVYASQNYLSDEQSYTEAIAPPSFGSDWKGQAGSIELINESENRRYCITTRSRWGEDRGGNLTMHCNATADLTEWEAMWGVEDDVITASGDGSTSYEWNSLRKFGDTIYLYFTYDDGTSWNNAVVNASTIEELGTK
jgi:hypothetical protein